MLTKTDKATILKALSMVDVKQLEIEIDESKPSKASPKKWFRFGSYNGLMIAQEIIKNLPEGKQIKVVDK